MSTADAGEPRHLEDFRGFRARPMHFEASMSDAEALMWQVEKDPWLDPSGAVVIMLDRPADTDAFRRRMAYAVSVVPRLRERVVPGIAALAPPRWLPDPEFDLDHHVRHLALPAPGSRRQLFDLASVLYQDPFDRTRPLWRFYLVEGLQGGGGAIISKMHHSIADGIGAVRLAEIYMDPSPEPDPTPEVDLLAIVRADRRCDPNAAGFGSRLTDAIGHQARRQAGIARRGLAELVMWSADPRRPFDASAHTLALVRNTMSELFGGADDGSSVGRSDDQGVGSSLWTDRSRHRSLQVFDLDLEAVKVAARARGGTVNDLFVAGVAEGAVRYHRMSDADLDQLRMTYVVSTRNDNAVGGNAWVPTKLSVSAEGTFDERMASVVARSTARKENDADRPSLDGLAAIAAGLPTSVLTQFARQQAAGIDIATSNLRAAPFPCYIGGARIGQIYPMGPVAGTACNVTTMSYDGRLGVGLFVDPAAVAEPERLRDCIADVFAEIV